MIKLLNIAEEARGGGPLKRIHEVADYLQDKGVNTEVLFPEKESEDFNKDLVASGIPTKRISITRLTKEKKILLWYVISFIPEIIHLISIIRKGKYDLVLCQGSYQIKGIIATRFTKAKSIWIQNDSQQPGIVQKLFKLVSGRADAFSFVSEKAKEYYSSINPKILEKPHIVIQSPIDMERFSPGFANLFSKDQVNILTVGYLNANKGFETLIEAVNIVNKENLKAKFYIVGPVLKSQEAYKQKLEDLIKKYNIKNIEFLGLRKDVVELLRSSDLYICSSYFEGSPIAVWEALSTATPILSSDVGDTRIILEKNGCGMVVPIKDIDAMANALINLISDEKLRKSLSENSREVAEGLFSLGSIAESYKSFYKKVSNLC